MSAIRTVFVSAVRHANDYLRILGEDPRVEIIAVTEESEAPEWMRSDSQRAAREADVPFENLDRFLAANPQADLAVICSEPTRHARLARMAMEAGLHVIIDKPAATLLEDGDDLLATSLRTGRVCAVINRTHAPALRRLRAWVDAGHLGLPRHLDIEFFASGAHFDSSVERPELVVDPDLSGGGELLNFLGYCADATTYLTGLRVEKVHAFTSSIFLAPHQGAGVEDCAVATLWLEKGVTATITLGRIPHAPGDTPTTSSIRLLGSHGNAVANDDQPAVALFGPSGRKDLSADVGQVAVTQYLRHVVNCLAEGTSPDYTIADARDTLAVIAAAYESEATRQVRLVRNLPGGD